MPAISIVSDYRAIQYTGSNSAEIDSAITSFDIISESGGVLNIQSPSGSTSYTVNTGDWVIYTQGQVTSVETNYAFGLFYVRNAIYSDVTALDARLDDVEAGSVGVQSVGVMDAPTLLLSQSTNVDVNIVPAMPSSSYTANVQLFAAASALGALSVTGVSILDADTVRVTIQNSGLVSLTGVRILVVATA